MTPRSVAAALLFALLIGGVAFYNDQVSRNTYLIGNYLPIAVYGPLIIVSLVLLPAWRRWTGSAGCRRGELAAWVAVVLFACYPAGRGFIHYFTTFLMMPHHHVRTRPAWQGEPARFTESSIRNWDALANWLAAAAGYGQDRHSARLSRLPARLHPPDPSNPQWRQSILDALNATLDDPKWFTLLSETRDLWPRWAREQWRRGAHARSPEWRRAMVRVAWECALGPDIVAERRPGVLERVPPRMLADPHPGDFALEGFVTGMANSRREISLIDIPWRPWLRTFAFWLPLLGAMALAVVGLSLVLHTQWAHHEHLPYPTAEFARALMPADDLSETPIHRDRRFWAGLVPVLLLHLVNYANAWWPDNVIPVQRTLDFSPLLELLPVFRRGGPHIIFQPTLYFTAIGFAYFLPTDVSLSLGIAPYVFVGITGWLAGYGIMLGGGHLQPHPQASLYAGAAMAMFLTCLYSGRRHFVSAFLRALGSRAGDAVGPAAVWGARAALGGLALFVAQLVIAGVDGPLAVAYTLLAVMIFTVISRLVAEAGVFFFHPHFYACGLLWSFLGTAAVGPDQLLLLGMASSLLLIDPREALMPYAISSLKIAEDGGVPVERIALIGLVATALAAAAAIPSALYWQYREGAVKTGDGWTINNVPVMVFNVNVSAVRTLEAQGRWSSRGDPPWPQRFRAIAPRRGEVAAFATSFALAMVFYRLRHRYPRWPLHPVLFVMGSHWQSRNLAFSFLLGWVVKSLVMKYGGAVAYRRAKPIAVGLVAGEVLAALVPLVIGALYHAVTGEPPKPFRIMPG